MANETTVFCVWVGDPHSNDQYLEELFSSESSAQNYIKSNSIPGGEVWLCADPELDGCQYWITKMTVHN